MNYQFMAVCPSSQTFYPNWPISLHGYIRHIRDIFQICVCVVIHEKYCLALFYTLIILELLTKLTSLGKLRDVMIIRNGRAQPCFFLGNAKGVIITR